jgi:hypothetical protein
MTARFYLYMVVAPPHAQTVFNTIPGLTAIIPSSYLSNIIAATAKMILAARSYLIAMW